MDKIIYWLVFAVHTRSNSTPVFGDLNWTNGIDNLFNYMAIYYCCDYSENYDAS